MYIEISKQQQSSSCKTSHPKCFKTTSFDRFHRKYQSIYIYRCERGCDDNVSKRSNMHLLPIFFSSGGVNTLAVVLFFVNFKGIFNTHKMKLHAYWEAIWRIVYTLTTFNLFVFITRSHDYENFPCCIYFKNPVYRLQKIVYLFIYLFI